MKIQVGIGEIVDKLTILMIKKDNILDPNKLNHINKELEYLNKIVEKLQIDKENISQLLDVNKKLWMIEDDIRNKERIKLFDDEFIYLARQVYITNDLRADMKRKINERYSSDFIEEKSYSIY
jgi:hypothetical protein